MAKRATGVGKGKPSGPRKTKKRLAIKEEMLANKKKKANSRKKNK